MAYQLIGKNFTPPDVLAKVTGKAKYAEDFRAEGMVFCRLLLSPMPRARVRNLDTSEAMKIKGVVGILTADDVPEQNAPANPILTNHPHYVGDPVLAVAAVDEQTAQDAIEKIVIDFEPLPFLHLTRWKACIRVERTLVKKATSAIGAQVLRRSNGRHEILPKLARKRALQASRQWNGPMAMLRRVLRIPG